MRGDERPARVCTSRTAANRPHARGDQRKRLTAIYWGSSGLVAASETAWVHRNTVTRKSVVVCSTPMTRNRPELPGSGRSRWTTNHLVTQQKTRNNRTYPDLWVANPLVAGSSQDPGRRVDARRPGSWRLTAQLPPQNGPYTAHGPAGGAGIELLISASPDLTHLVELTELMQYCFC
jgi:hypothetical protein